MAKIMANGGKMESRRLTAQKANILELVKGKFVRKSGFESSYVLTQLGRKISRARICGLVVDKFISEDGNYATLTIDDGTETIRCKFFVNTKIIDSVAVGELIDAVGKLREYNNEIYVAPEIIKKVEPNFETLRLLELGKIWTEQKKIVDKVKELKKQSADAVELKAIAKKAGFSLKAVEGVLEAEEFASAASEEQSATANEAKTKILKLIEQLDKGDGVEYQIILKQAGLPENIIDVTIQELLESGLCFEPRAGKIKKV